SGNGVGPYGTGAWTCGRSGYRGAPSPRRRMCRGHFRDGNRVLPGRTALGPWRVELFPRTGQSGMRAGRAGDRQVRRPPSPTCGRARPSAAERGVEGGAGRLEVVCLQAGQCLRGALEAVHAGVLPLDRHGAAVPDGAQHAENVLPGDVAVAGGDEVPAAAGVAPGQVGAEAAVAAVQALACLLAVDVVDAVAEVPQEADRVEVLPHEVGRVEVEAEGRPVADGFEGADGGPVVVGDLAGVHLVGEAHAFGVEDVEDGVPAGGEVLVAALDHHLGGGREHGDQVPDRGAGEADDGVDAEAGRGPCGVLDLGGGPLPDALRLTVAPDPGGQDGLVAFVDDGVAHRLADQVVGDRPALESVLVEQLVPGVDVGGVGEGLVHLEVVAPAGEFEPVVAEVAGESADLLQGQVGPLAGEQREVARHPYPSSSGGDRRVDGVLLCALLHGGQDALHLESVGEGGIGGAALGDRVDQVARLVHEGVLVAEAVARRPPGVQVGVVR